MPIVFSAITPHSPLLIPAVGKDNLIRLKKTNAAFKKLEEELYASKPETIIIISPHGVIQANSFTMNLSPKFSASFEEFGDFTVKKSFNGDIGLGYKIRERMETRAPLQLVSTINLDYGASVPIITLTEHLPNIKIIPLYYSGLDFEAHFHFGQLLKRELLVSKNRVAIIASAELSHKITKSAPAGYSPKGKKFDLKLIELIEKEKIKDILDINKSLVAEICECGFKSILTLLGIMDGFKYKPQKLSYEAPFGIGYLIMNFKI
jgi:aromatic ring-opening dioxygenase LigB subunit